MLVWSGAFWLSSFHPFIDVSRNVTPDKYEGYRIDVIFPGHDDLVMKLKYLTPSVSAHFVSGAPS
jgi:hypothetical protein